uniref:Small ribosomal subunit protein uS15c n=1 Tax=Gymnosphaera podophylla TaxID=204585 RepID=A0A344AIT5_9MONI|nr:ribosomal protein S15 [Alsophila podophylla]AWV63426.1 ribosomal protein S15 [Alsophila podophylla]
MNKKISIDLSLMDENKRTGSAGSQVYYLTHQVSKLTSHLELHPKDYSSQRGLWKLLGKRKRLSIYLSDKNPTLYNRVVKNLSIRGLKGR